MENLKIVMIKGFCLFLLAFLFWGCSSEKSAIARVNKWSGVDVHSELIDVQAFALPLWGNQVVVHGVLADGDAEGFIRRHGLRRTASTERDLIKGNFGDFSDVAEKYRRSSDVQKVYTKQTSHPGSVTVLVMIYLDEMNGSVWISVSSD